MNEDTHTHTHTHITDFEKKLALSYESIRLIIN